MLNKSTIKQVQKANVYLMFELNAKKYPSKYALFDASRFKIIHLALKTDWVKIFFVTVFAHGYLRSLFGKIIYHMINSLITEIIIPREGIIVHGR
mgnify:CR=1 FL=1